MLGMLDEKREFRSASTTHLLGSPVGESEITELTEIGMPTWFYPGGMDIKALVLSSSLCFYEEEHEGLYDRYLKISPLSRRWDTWLMKWEMVSEIMADGLRW